MHSLQKAEVGVDSIKRAHYNFKSYNVVKTGTGTGAEEWIDKPCFARKQPHMSTFNLSHRNEKRYNMETL